jgi:hypothetical protein
MKEEGDTAMRFMILLTADAKSEAGVMPSENDLSAMLKFNEELVNAGVMLAGEGLQPSSKGARVKFHRGTTSVTDGPFAEAKELIAGFWIWNCASKEEAIEWVKRIPVPEEYDPNQEYEIEIRQVFETDDFGPELTPELRAKEGELRTRVEQQNQPR